MTEKKTEMKCITCGKVRFLTKITVYYIKTGRLLGNCLSCSLKGNKNQLIKHSKETKLKMRIARLGKKLSLQHRLNMSKARKGVKTGRIPKTAFKKGVYTKAMRKGSLLGAKTVWSKENKEKQIKAILKGLIKRPTYLEKQMIDIIKRNNLPYKYTGNGTFLIGYKNPDFVNINGEKKLIEVGNVYHHQNNYENERRNHFAKYGWKSYIFIQDHLDEKQILSVLLKGG